MQEVKKVTFLKALSIAVSLSFSATILILIFCAPIYMENDDAMIEMIASGAVSGSPSPYLILSSSMVGMILNNLYSIFPATNWYSLYLLIAYSSTFVVLYYLALSKTNTNTFNVIIKCCVLIFIQVIVTVEPQFTVISILMAFTAFLVLIRYNDEQKSGLLFVGLTLIIFSNLIRFESIYIFLILCIPLIFIISWVTRKYTSLLYSSLVLLIMFCITLIDHRNISKQMGYDVFSFIRATETIIDNPNTINDDDIGDVEWSKNDLYLMQTYFFVDESKYTHKNIQALASGKKGFRSMQEFYHIFFEIISPYLPQYLLLILLIFSSYFKMPKERRFLNVLLLIITFLLIGILMMRMRMPIHLFLPLFLCPFLFFIDSIVYKSHRFSYSTIFILLLLNCFIIFKGINERKTMRDIVFENMSYIQQQPQYLFHFFDIQQVKGFFGIKNLMHQQPRGILVFGWVIGTPAYRDHLVHHQLQSGHLRGLYERDEIRLMSQSDMYVRLIERQINERFDPLFSFEVCDSINGSKVYKAK